MSKPPKAITRTRRMTPVESQLVQTLLTLEEERLAPIRIQVRTHTLNSLREIAKQYCEDPFNVTADLDEGILKFDEVVKTVEQTGPRLAEDVAAEAEAEAEAMEGRL